MVGSPELHQYLPVYLEEQEKSILFHSTTTGGGELAADQSVYSLIAPATARHWTDCYGREKLGKSLRVLS